MLGIGDWLARLRVGRRQQYAADFAPDALLELAFDTQLLAQVADQTETGATPDDSLFEVAEQFRGTIGSRFFLHPNEVDKVLAQIAVAFPDWLKRLDRETRDWVDRSLPIYNHDGPALAQCFVPENVALGPGNDALYRYRPHRFAFFPALCLAVQQGMLAPAVLRTILGAWMQQASSGSNPYCFGSNLVVIQRILALSWGWIFLASRQAIRNRDGLMLEFEVLRILLEDVRFLWPRLGNSVPNNHLLADRFAAWYLVTVFPEFLTEIDGGAEQRWVAELLEQTYPDGGSFEHSTHYHEFASEMGAAFLLLSRRNSHVPDSRVVARVRALLSYQCVLAGRASRPISIGDAVEDTLFPLDLEAAWCLGTFRELYRALFDSGIGSPQGNDAQTVRAYWLLAGQLALPTTASGEGVTAEFPQAGVFSLGDSVHDAQLVFRTGPAPGQAHAAGHAHADLLSICVNSRGNAVLVDPGTYTYRRQRTEASSGEPDWRAYFNGPNAHNGASVEGVDPMGTFPRDFRPHDVAVRVRATQRHGPGIRVVDASIEGGGAYDGFRRACIHIDGEYWLILDFLPVTDADRKRWLGFQFAHTVKIDMSGNAAVCKSSHDSAVCSIAPDEALGSPVGLFASFAPLGGWVSPDYGVRHGATQLRYPVDAQGGFSAFVVNPEASARLPVVKCWSLDEDEAWVISIQWPESCDWVVYRHGPGAESVNVREAGLTTDARLFWARGTYDQLDEVRWLAGRKLEWPSREISLCTASEEQADLCAGKGRMPQVPAVFSDWNWPGVP